MRKKIIAGNWKMNKTPAQAAAFAKEMAAKADNASVDVVFCVPYTAISTAINAVAGTNVAIGAQNMHFEESGAYTGEIAPGMLTEIGVKYVIIGHSERRAYFGETDCDVNKKLKVALAHGLIPIVCVGESLTQRQLGITIEHVRIQVKAAFDGISAADATKAVIAYEPIWAIGTGVTATSAQAEEACAAVRQVVGEIYDAQTAEAIRIQYGGSVTADNAAELFNQSNIDGGLVGGASIKDDFDRIVNYKR
ncbi:MAG: triose-phosphate isomerase [Defluviitaleaceae bacterium]|nr:triose-phosphate isomerase [Defluviitaleaceae bacterium]